MKKWTLEEALNFADGFWHVISLSKPHKGELDPEIKVAKTFLDHGHHTGWNSEMIEAIEAIDPAICDAMLANQMIVTGTRTTDWAGYLEFIQPENKSNVARYVYNHLKEIIPNENLRNLKAAAYRFHLLKIPVPRWIAFEIAANLAVLEEKGSSRPEHDAEVIKNANEWLCEFFSQYDPKKKK
jgi:hypothetical protein